MLLGSIRRIAETEDGHGDLGPLYRIVGQPSFSRRAWR